MKKYQITVSNGQGWWRTFTDSSRNAKQHLINTYGPMDGARCVVRTMDGLTVSACVYSDEFGYYYATT